MSVVGEFRIVYFALLLCFLCLSKQKTAYEWRIRDWSSDVCSSDLQHGQAVEPGQAEVEDDRVVVLHVALVPGRFAVGGGVHHEPGRLERARQVGADVGLVLDDQATHQSSLILSTAPLRASRVSLRTRTVAVSTLTLYSQTPSSRSSSTSMTSPGTRWATTSRICASGTNSPRWSSSRA